MRGKETKVKGSIQEELVSFLKNYWLSLLLVTLLFAGAVAWYIYSLHTDIPIMRRISQFISMLNSEVIGQFNVYIAYIIFGTFFYTSYRVIAWADKERLIPQIEGLFAQPKIVLNALRPYFIFIALTVILFSFAFAITMHQGRLQHRMAILNTLRLEGLFLPPYAIADMLEDAGLTEADLDRMGIRYAKYER